MTAPNAYVRNRDGVFQYERRVPIAVQRHPHRFAAFFGSKALFRRSLRTKEVSTMYATAKQVHDEFEALLAKATGKVAPRKLANETATRKLTDADLDGIVARYTHLTAEPFERLHRLAPVDPAAALELERLERELEMYAPDISAALDPRQTVSENFAHHRPIEEARFIARRDQFAASEGSEALGAIAGAVRVGLEQGYRRISALGNADVAPSMTRQTAPATKPTNLSIRLAVETYLEDRSLSIKGKRETELSLRLFEKIVGNKRLADLTKGDFVAFVKDQSNQKVGGKSEGSIERYLGVESIKKRVRFLKLAIQHAIDCDRFDGPNVATGINVATFVKRTDLAVMPKKRRLRIDEINTVLRHPWFTGCKSLAETHEAGNVRLDGMEYWVPIVALFTGCRAGELGGLKLSEVRLNDKYPHLIIRDNEFRRTKKGFSRSVPLLDALMDHGFADYVQRVSATGAERLFPDWIARKAVGAVEADDPAWSNAAVIRAYNRTVIPTMLGDEMIPGARRDVTFHSFRGAFKAMLSLSDIPPVMVHDVIGHSKSGLDQSYLGQFTIDETYPKVHSCNYKGLVLPPIF